MRIQPQRSKPCVSSRITLSSSKATCSAFSVERPCIDIWIIFFKIDPIRPFTTSSHLRKLLLKISPPLPVVLLLPGVAVLFHATARAQGVHWLGLVLVTRLLLCEAGGQLHQVRCISPLRFLDRGKVWWAGVWCAVLSRASSECD